mgnify:CR=1 FL=1
MSPLIVRSSGETIGGNVCVRVCTKRGRQNVITKTKVINEWQQLFTQITYLTTPFPISSALSTPPTESALVTFELMIVFLVFVKIFIVNQIRQSPKNRNKEYEFR